MFRAYAPLLATCLAALIAPIASTAAADSYANVHSIGVVSTVGQRLYFNRVGVAGYELDTESVDMTAWRIDDQIVRWVAEALRPRFAAKAVTLPDGALAHCPILGKCVPVLPADDSVDAYLLVLPEQQKDPYTLQHWYCSGIHVMRHNTWPVTPPNDLFPTYGVAVFNAKTGRRIDYGTSGPWIRMVPGEWTDHENLTEQQWTNLRSTLFRSFAVPLPYVLGRANLIETPHDLDNADFNAIIGGLKPPPLLHDDAWLSQPYVKPGQAPGPATIPVRNCGPSAA